MYFGLLRKVLRSICVEVTFKHLPSFAISGDKKNSLRQFVWEGIKEPVWHARANKFLIFLAYIHAVNGGVSAIYAFLMVGQEHKKNTL